jgi:hypothetical protein
MEPSNNPWYSPPVRRRFTDRQKALGLGSEEMMFFFQHFAPWYCALYMKTNRHWFRGKRPPFVTKYVVMDHLEGNCWIGFAPSARMRWFVIDLDAKRNPRSLAERYRSIVQVFGPALVVQSSRSGGLHLYYFLKEPLRPGELTSIVRLRLQEAGIAIKRGLVEDFPGIINQLRVPLGDGSCVLNPESLLPLSLDLRGQIRYIMKWEAEHRLEPWLPGPPEEPSTEPITAPAPPPMAPRPHYQVPRPQSGGVRYPLPPELPSDIREIRERRVEYGTRNERMLPLIRWSVSQGWSDDEVVGWIMSWLSEPGHKSRTMEDDPKEVERELRAAIQSYRKRPKGTRHPRFLSVADVATIVALTEGLKRSSRFGHEAYHAQRFLFSLLQWARTLGKPHLFLPYRFLRNLDGSSEERVVRQVAFLEERGILKLEQPANRHRKLSRVYSLHFEFTAGMEVRSLNEGLRLLYDRSTLFKLYARREYEAILKVDS